MELENAFLNHRFKKDNTKMTSTMVLAAEFFIDGYYNMEVLEMEN